MLADVESIFGHDRRVVVARELTKVHEELLRGTAAEVSAELKKRTSAKGEITVIVSTNAEGQRPAAPTRSLAQRVRELMTSDAMDEKDALKQAAREFGVSKSEGYREWQRGKAITGKR
jgi:16S rRNA (cytidine1402-2'-O)-methyltransferase